MERQEMGNNFRKKSGKIYDEDGLYVTRPQLNLFMNGFLSGDSPSDEEFNDYLRSCKAYNFIGDMMDDDPNCAALYWDTEQGDFVFKFPPGGKVEKALLRLRAENEC